VSDVKEREQEQATRSQAKLFKLKMALGVEERSSRNENFDES
jgi:hypothetical protein